MGKMFFVSMAILLMLAPLAAQSVMVVSPNGGESWVLGSSHNITWTPTNAGNIKVDIILRNSGGKVGVIKSQVALSAGLWTWMSVGKLEDGTIVAPGTDYIVRIRNTANTVTDDSNNAFSIVASSGTPTLQLLIPNGGESWTRGHTMNITWKAENWTGTVQLSLFLNGVYKGIIAPSRPSSPGTYLWSVGTTSNGLADFDSRYRVSVTRTYAGPLVPQVALGDKSDGDFSISVLKIAGPVHMETAKLAKTVTLGGAIANSYHGQLDESNNSGCFHTTGTGPEPDPFPQMRTGYSNYHKGGYCWESYRYAYRCILKFDLSQIKGQITNARIDMQCTGTDSTDGTPYCDGTVLVLDGPGTGFTAPSHLFTYLPSMGETMNNGVIKVSGPNIQITVTDLVKAWIGGQQPNFGIVFTGNNESYSENNNRCISTFHAVLQVTYVPAD